MKKLFIILLVLTGLGARSQNIHVPSGFTTPAEFGGVGDGVTVNTTALQAAINYWIPYKGGNVFLPPGRWYTHKINFPVNCPIHFYGVAPVNQNVTAGFGADSAFGGSQLVTDVTNDSLIVNNANGTVIENIGIRCTSTTTSTTNVGIAMDSSNYCFLQNVWLDNFNQDVYVYGGIFWNMYKVTFRNGHEYGLQVNGYPADEEAGDSRVDHCLFDVTDNTRAGSDTLLNYTGAGGLQVSHCKFSGGVRPVHVAPWLAFSDFHFDNNSVENYTGTGTALDIVVNGSVGIGSMSNLQILGNQFYGFTNGSPVIYINASGSAGFVMSSEIDDNVIETGAGDTCIYVNNPNAGADLNIGPANKYSPVGTCIPYAGNITLSGEGGVPFGRVTLAEGRKIICDLRQARYFLISGAMTGNDTLNIIGGVQGEPFAITCTQGAGNYQFLLNYDGTSTTNQVGVSSFVINPSPTNGATTIIYGYATGILSANITGINYYSAGSGFSNPMTTTGDMIYSSSGSTPARLGIGSTGQVLTVVSGVPAWAAGTSYTFSNSLVNTSGTVTLVNDNASPGNSMLYGTNSSGTLGWYAQPGGGGISGLTTGYMPVATSSTTIGNSTITTNSSGKTIFAYGSGYSTVFGYGAGNIDDRFNGSLNIFNDSAGAMVVGGTTIYNSGVFNVTGTSTFNGTMYVASSGTSVGEFLASGTTFDVNNNANGLFLLHCDGQLNAALFPSGRTGVGGSATDDGHSDFQSYSTTLPQIEGAYNSTNYWTIQANSSGNATFTASGGTINLAGTPTAATATSGTNTTQIATTAFVMNAVGSNTGGIYLPTSSGSSNIASITLDSATYIRGGNTISVDGSVTITATSGGSVMSVYLLVPVNSLLSNGHALFGMTTNSSTMQADGIVKSDGTANKAWFSFANPGSTSAVTYYYHYSYQVQ